MHTESLVPTEPDDKQKAHSAPLPAPTLWPAALALGSTLVLWGLISSLIITVLGAIFFIVALGGWVREIRHEHKP